MRSFLKSHLFETVEVADVQLFADSSEINPVAHDGHEIEPMDTENLPEGHLVQKTTFEMNRPVAHNGHATNEEHNGRNALQLN
jgi:hypothetical protein